MSYERLDSCPSCQSSSLQNSTIAVDHFKSKESFVISKCNECGLLFTNPRPDKENISAYYQSEDYISHSDRIRGPIDLVYRIARNYMLGQKERLINKHSKKGRVLDYGCGTGSFLQYCRKKGWETIGIEPDDSAREIATDKNNGNVYSTLSEIPEQKFEIITLWHVLEHVHELTATLTSLKKLLSKDGTLIVAVPNHESWDAKHYKDFWAGWDVPRHLYHFSQRSMKTLMASNNFTVKEIVPMKLDSFYVSMLSERYKTGSNALLKAYRSGKRSNREAVKNNNYSSLIYVIK